MSRGVERASKGLDAGALRMPAEWEPHRATWIAWPHKSGDWPTKHGAIPWVFTEMVRLLHHGERVGILVEPGWQVSAERMLGASGVDLSRVDFVRVRSDRSWTRDYLPTFVLDERAKRKRHLVAVKWRFNGWARYPDHKRDESAGALIAERVGELVRRPELVVRGRMRRVVAEGGGLEVDGQGTLITSEHWLLTGPRPRNRGATRQELEAVFAEFLGVRTVIWVGDGIAGDDTSGHVDDFVRFVAPGIVVLCREASRSDPNHRNLDAAREVLRASRDAKGGRLEIVTLPMPSPVVFRRDRLPASYANFYIGNGVVLVPTFNDPQDSVALGVLRELFPGRAVVGVHARDLVLGLGTLHCSTQQEPRV